MTIAAAGRNCPEKNMGVTTVSKSHANLDSAFVALCIRGVRRTCGGGTASVFAVQSESSSSILKFREKTAGMRMSRQTEMDSSEGQDSNTVAYDLREDSLQQEQAGDENHTSSGHGRTRNGKQSPKDNSREKLILALYDEYRPRLYRYIRSMHLGRDQAEEIVQETFMRLTMEFMKEGELENVQGWIVRVARNLAINVLKKERGPALNAESHTSLMENQADPTSSPEEVYSKQERYKLMHTLVESLKPQHRRCFQMRAQGLRYKDIALAIGISEQRAAFLVKQVAVRLAAIFG
jgi:RNA polymerase sigma-70 factor (ECF subfamily)